MCFGELLANIATILLLRYYQYPGVKGIMGQKSIRVVRRGEEMVGSGRKVADASRW